ncbi:MAG TPA: hypothetical protein PLL78_12330 [Fimbriimonadaceae bacterium]|nr:hypothetical protein [Fimbriimonadaceae bacterium]HRJ97463.1 hypothetical protein [Fimbriimonadaceae bacterium]
MKVRLVILASIATLFVVGVAVAQNTAAAAHGRGVARNEQNVRGTFNFEVGRRPREGGGSPIIAGRLTFRSENPTERVVTEVTMTQIVQLAFANPKVSEFGGRGVLVRRNGIGETRRFEGRLSVRVQDRRTNGRGEPDLFRIQFWSADNRQLLNFNARVLDGDIVVRM